MFAFEIHFSISNYTLVFMCLLRADNMIIERFSSQKEKIRVWIHNMLHNRMMMTMKTMNHVNFISFFSFSSQSLLNVVEDCLIHSHLNGHFIQSKM